MKGLNVRVWAVGLVSVGGAAWVAACGYGYWESVHFNDVADFGMPPPPLVIGAWEESSTRPVPTTSFSDNEEEYAAREKRQAQNQARGKELRAAAEALEAAGKTVEAADAWAKLVSELRDADLGYSEKPIDFEAARDRAEVLRQAGTGALAGPVVRYLQARKTLEEKPDDKVAKGEIRKLAAPGSGFIQAHAAYAVADWENTAWNLDSASKLFEAAAELGGPRREPALMMAIRSRLGVRSSWFEKENVRVEDVARGKALIATLLKEYPETRFRKSAEGWSVRADFLAGNQVAALKRYLQELDAEKDPEKQAGLLSSVRKVVEALKPEEAKSLRATILAEPDLLQPYLDFRLYHTESSPAQLGTLVSFANEVLAKKPAAPLSSAVEARLAEIAYLQGDAKRALSYAERSLKEANGPREDLAVYVRAASLHRAGQDDQAAKALEGYEEKYPSSYLRKAAIEQRAVIGERRGTWFEAVADYEKLGYKQDVAYILDVRLDPAQVETYAERKNDSVAKLTAGYRQLRANNFAAATKWFESIPEAERRKVAKVGSRDYAWLEPEKATSPLDSIPDPLTTARDLAKLQRDKSAKGLYALASYYYTRRNLLLYNAALWDGSRGALGWAWNAKIATPEDSAARQKHFFEHECVARSRAICLEVAKRYPKSPVAGKALYRAATSTRRLAGFNGWWRSQNAKTNRYEAAANLLKRVYTEYPKDPLAKNARKYEKVYRQEGAGAVMATMFGPE